MTEYLHKPAYYLPKSPQPQDERDSKAAEDAFDALDEARTLLALLNVYPAIRMMWSQPMDWMEAGGMGSGWQVAPGSEFTIDKGLDCDSAAAIANDYFAIESSLRSTVLRVPLDRLNKALAERDFTDRVIDLGVGLEALLLHKLGKDRAELGFRFSLHGAWLLGTTPGERGKVQRALRSMYQLRSQAVHVGYVEYDTKNAAVFGEAIELCQKLILKMITRKCAVDWSQLVMGPERESLGSE